MRRPAAISVGMDEFRMISTILAMVLGLAVTRLLLGFVTVFRLRSRSAVDWITVTWAGVLFIEMLEYWWAINHLAAMRSTFGFADFLFLVGLTLTLFVASALILPSRAEDEDGSLRAYFERDGRYGLAALVAFHVLGMGANIHYFGQSPIAVWALLDVPIILLPALVLLASSRRVRAWTTAAYVPLLAVDLWVSLAVE
ncbi:hypothetical protein ACTZWW_08770 [Salinarimonas sp. NSM]|uniref:hypothetical protein n=1 Tax=Salinarimonas sp. NSM TaxID=3458003 RepID=UPI0040369167